MIHAVLASMLVLHPIVEEDTTLRLVAVGTEEHDVEWVLDGAEVARSADGEAVEVDVAAGRHELQASTRYQGEWQILVRPDPRNGTGASYVPAWTARHEPRPEAAAEWEWVVPAGILTAAGVAFWPRRRSM